MLENLFTNVFGRSKGKSSTGRTSQHDPSTSSQPGSQMTGPFSTSAPQMPQPPSLPYPPAPYPSGAQNQGPSSYYPSLPFSQPPDAGHGSLPQYYNTGTLLNKQVSPLDSVPFEAKLTLNNSTNLVSLDELFHEIKKAADVVDRVDAYLRSSESDYDFKIEQGLISQ